jgi:hypothetical protein
LKKWLRVVLLGLFAVVALYYVGLNALLASPLGERLLSFEPELFRIRYDRAWTLIPGRVEVRGFELCTQDKAVQLMITAERVSGRLHPWLMADLHFYATDVEADGVALRVRPRVKEGDEKKAHLAELPPIAAYESPLISQAELDAPRGPLVLLEFKGLVVHHLREVWIDRMRYAGDAELSGGMFYKPLSRLRLQQVRFADANSKLVLSDNEIALERLEASLQLNDLDLVEPKAAAFREFSAELDLKATLEPRFLNGYLTNVRGLSTLHAKGTPGVFELTAKIEKGVVAEGLVLTYVSPRVSVRIPYVDISGRAAVKGSSTKKRLSLNVEVTKAALTQRDGDRLAEADRFAVLASSDVDLTQVDSVDAQLVLSGGRVPSLAALNQFIPPGAGVRLSEGQGEVEGKLALDSGSERGRGELDLTANAVVKNRSAMVKGLLKVHGEVKSLDLKTGALDLSGSTVAIEEATLTAPGRSWPLWVKAVADSCVRTPKGKVEWSTTFTVGASNLEPLLAIVSANLPLPKALGILTNSPNVKAQADLVVREDGIDLPRLSLNSQTVRAQGAMALRQVSEADERLQPWGNALVKAGVFSAGVQLDGPKISLVLFGLDKWAEAKKLKVP